MPRRGPGGRVGRVPRSIQREQAPGGRGRGPEGALSCQEWAVERGAAHRGLRHCRPRPGARLAGEHRAPAAPAAPGSSAGGPRGAAEPLGRHLGVCTRHLSGCKPGLLHVHRRLGDSNLQIEVPAGGEALRVQTEGVHPLVVRDQSDVPVQEAVVGLHRRADEAPTVCP